MTSWQIGSTTLRNVPGGDGSPVQSSVANGVLSVSGRFYAEANLAAGEDAGSVRDAFRQQWEGMLGETVPIVAGDEFAKTGLWTCRTATISDTYDTDRGYLGYSASFARLRSSTNPLAEQRIISKLRPNSDNVQVTDIVSRVVWNADALYTTLPVSSSFQVPGGLMNQNNRADYEGERLHLYNIDPTSYYIGGASLEFQYPDGIWRPARGRQVPASVTSLGQVRVSTGRQRARFDLTASPPTLVLEDDIHLPSPVSGLFRVRDAALSSPVDAVPEILRNDVTRVTIRVWSENGVFVQLSAERGRPYVEGVVGSVDSDQVFGPTAIHIQAVDGTGQGVIGGMTRVGNDANGKRWGLFVPHPLAKTTSNPPNITTDGTETGAWAISYGDDPPAARDTYYAGQSVTQSIVAT